MIEISAKNHYSNIAFYHMNITVSVLILIILKYFTGGVYFDQTYETQHYLTKVI